VVNNEPVATRLLTATRGAVTARTFGKGLVYLLLALPLDVVAALVLLAGGLLGTVLLITPVGAWWLAGLLRVASGLGGLRRGMAARLLGLRVPAPAPPMADGGAFGWRRAMLTDPVGWRALAYAMAKLPVSVLSLFLGGGGYMYAFVMVTFFPLQEQRINSWWALGARWLLSLVLLLLAPWMLRSVLAVEKTLVRGLLGASPSAQRMTDLRETRDRAVTDADATLRRIERDLHDGAQARLIGVGIQLAMVSELIAAGAPPQRLRAAVDTTQDTLATAIAELRDLVRGIHPAVLDRGLGAALTTVAAGSAVPTTLSIDLPRRPLRSSKASCTSAPANCSPTPAGTVAPEARRSRSASATTSSSYEYAMTGTAARTRAPAAGSPASPSGSAL
jgi:hypothetical protein